MHERGRGTGTELPKGASEVLAGIERWRAGGRRGSGMPEELWERAVRLASEHGVYGISRALGLSYGTLRARFDRSASVHGALAGAGSRRQATRRTSRKVQVPGARVDFLELDAPGVRVEQPSAAEVIVEVAEGTGSRLMVRVLGGGVDVAAIVGAFRGERR